MSTETHVFFRGKLPTKAALSRAMKELGYPFALKPATGSLEQQSGFMPMTLRREETGVEFDVFDDRSAVKEYAGRGVDQSYERVANFRWSGDFEEAVAGMCAAAALAKLVNGVVFDEAEDKLLSADEAIALASRTLQALAKPDAVRQPGTRPADIKRYLKPLLKQRNDLVLMGRCLMIRPVRHLRRGAFLDRTSDKYGFRVWRYIAPLYHGGDGVGYGDYLSPPVCKVWQPHFEPMLLDCLAEDVFDYVGRMTTLADFAHALEGTHRFHSERVAGFVLAGERERAAAYVSEMETKYSDNDYFRSWAARWRALMEEDIGSICARFRSREAETVRELKLGDIWEPAPFAAEVPASERATKCGEPRFDTTPWISRPPGLLGEPPEHPGEVRFAKETRWRKGRVILVLPLTREQAEEKHRTHQDYALATRLHGGILLVLSYRTGWSPHDPEQPRNPDYVPTRGIALAAYGSFGCVRAQFDEGFDARGVLKMRSVSVYDSIGDDEIWYAFNDFRDQEKCVRDHRVSPNDRTVRPMTASDHLRFSAPPFGEFNELWDRTHEYLRNEGFGTLE